ncbi:MAG TPA: efflux RND transporter periplasmic adaptor subunit [Phaeodactylibacter sp.]|nr:efflux RND transporter periplasmic adaptor subunit [Phaeodactylibacter sp.]
MKKTTFMKTTYVSIVFLMLFLGGCSLSLENERDEKEYLLQEKKEALHKLQQEIEALEAELYPQGKKEEALLVTQLEVQPKKFEHFVEFQGTVQSDELISVSTETGGRMTELKVREGQAVHKGQLVAVFDLSELEKQLAELETSLELARDLYERQQRLWDQQIGSEVQLLQAKNRVERLEKSKEALEARLAKARVYAPLSGQVERVLVHPGEVAAPGMPVVQLLNARKVKVVAEVPENYLSIARKGKKVEIDFPVIGEKRSARIDAVGQLINPSNRTFSVECYLDNPKGLLKPNLLGTIRLSDVQVEDALVIPIDLVQTEVGGKEFVYVIEEAGEELVAKKVYIETGLRQGSEVEVKTGLKAGDRLVRDGAYKVVDGQPLRLHSK